MGFIEIFIVIGTVLFLIYKYGTRTFSHWKDKGVPVVWEPSVFIGNSSPVFQGKTALEFINVYYDALKGKRCGGFYIFRQPALLLRDPELIKQITIKEFDHFVNRNPIVEEGIDGLSGKTLLALKDQKWRDMRSTLSPAFTTSKLKNMYQLVHAVGEQMSKYLEAELKKQGDNVIELEMKAFYNRFTTDVIATAAFGVEVDSMSDPNNVFYTIGQKMSANFENIGTLIMFKLLPGVMKALGKPFFGKEPTEFYEKLVRETIKTRDAQKIIRPDMIHLLMQSRHGGTVGEQDQEYKGKALALSTLDITAQAVIFFLAGFETVSTFLSFCSYELAQNQDVQNKLHQEIDRIAEEDGGQITYESLMTKMKYLDMVTSETLRRWPPAHFADRSVSSPFIIPASDTEPAVPLQKGDTIWLPIASLHLDPNYFPDPLKFDPERFNEENKPKIKPFTYLPFGSGPRNCIGMRFALMEGKSAMVHLLQHYRIVVTAKTPPQPLQLDRKTFRMRAEDGFWLGLESRHK